MKRLIAFLAVMMLVSVASGTAVSITIYGTNRSNAQTNVTDYGANNTVIVNAWNTSYVKNITVNSTNVSGDTFSFNISNVTANSIFELKVNGTSINGYKAGANGMLNFTYIMPSNLNQTFVISPAIRANGYNMTWAWLQNLIVDKEVGIGKGSSGNPGVMFYVGSILKAQVYEESGDNTLRLGTGTGAQTDIVIDGNGKVGIGTASPTTVLEVNGIIRGNGSGLWGLNASNLTIPTISQQNSVDMACSTVYQNTNSTAIFVNAQLQLVNASVTTTFYSDASNPPTTTTARSYTAGGANPMTISSWVLPNNYYYWTNTNCAMLGTVIWK